MKHLGHTPGFAERVDTIADIGYVRLGGIEQWVMIRGENVANPPLILLHGGPGMTEMRFFRHFNAPLEKSFTVVNWDQRGTGKSFSRDIPRESMNVEQFIADLDDLVEHVRHRLEQEKVVLYGHSWGSALGVLYAARFPEKVAVYAGSGQVGDWLAAERASYDYVLREMERRNDAKAVRKLRAIGPPPYGANALWTERMQLARLDHDAGAMPITKTFRILLGGPESSVVDAPNLWRGWRFSLDAMWDDVLKLNLIEAVPALRMPVFFLLGRKDHWVDPATSMAYFNVLDAPYKQVIWFEHSGHEPFMDEPEKFNAAMIDIVRPALEAG